MLILEPIIRNGFFLSAIDPIPYDSMTLPLIGLALSFLLGIFGLIKIRQLNKSKLDLVKSSEELSKANSKWRKSKIAIVLPGFLIFAYLGYSGYTSFAIALAIGALSYFQLSKAKLGIAGKPATIESCNKILIYSFVLTQFGIWRAGLHFAPPGAYMTLLFLALYIVLATGIFSKGFVEKGHPGFNIGKLAFLIVTTLLCFVVFFTSRGTPFNFFYFISGPKEKEIRSYIENPPKNNNSAHWKDWEQVALTAKANGMNFDPASAEAQLLELLQEDDNPFIIANAQRAGIFQNSHLALLREKLERSKGRLLKRDSQGGEFYSLPQRAWEIRAHISSGQLNDEQLDILEERLLATWRLIGNNAWNRTEKVYPPKPHDYNSLERFLLLSNLLKELGRPIKSQKFSEQVTSHLEKCFRKNGVGFEPAGGFAKYPSDPHPSLDGTWTAIQLMEEYGYPESVDIHFLRSYLKPWHLRSGARAYTASLLLKQLNSLIPPEVESKQRATILKIAAAESPLISVLILVALCFYSIFSAQPLPTATKPSAQDKENEMDDE